MVTIEIDQQRAVRLEDCPELQFVETLLLEKDRRDGTLDPLLAPVEPGHEHETPPTVTSVLRQAMSQVVESSRSIIDGQENIHKRPQVELSYFFGQEACRIIEVLESAAYDEQEAADGTMVRHPQQQVAAAILENRTVAKQLVRPGIRFTAPDRYPTEPLPQVDDLLDHSFDLRSPYEDESNAQVQPVATPIAV